MAVTLKDVRAIDFSAGRARRLVLERGPDGTSLELKLNDETIFALTPEGGPIFSGDILPDTDDGASLGEAGRAWSDLFLADGGVIDWDSGDVTITHSSGALAISASLSASNDTGATTPAVSAENTVDAASVEVLRLIGNRATPTTGDEAYMTFYLEDDGGASTEAARITAVGTDLEDFSADLVFAVPSEGNFENVFALNGGNGDVEVNPDNSGTVGFKVKGANNDNIIRLNAGADCLGFGANANASSFMQVDHDSQNRPIANDTGLGIHMPSGTQQISDASGLTAIGSVVRFPQATWTSSVATRTVTDVATLYIAGAPIASTNVTFTNTAMALWVDAGKSRFDGEVDITDLQPSGTALTINDDGADVDVVIESLGNAAMFVMNSGTNSYGLGGSASAQSFINIVGGNNARVHANSQGYILDIDVDTYTDQANGALANHHAIVVRQPTISTTNTTGTNAAATLFIENAPAVSGGGSITNPYALFVGAGLTRLDNATGATTPALQVVNTSNNTAVEVARFANDRTVGAASDSAYVSFYLDDEDGDPAENARIAWEQSTASSGDQDSTVTISSVFNNSLDRQVTFQGRVSPGTVFNPDQLDVNFVIASPNLANAFEMDAGRDAIGIGDGAETESLFLLDGTNASRSRASAQGILMETRAGTYTQTNADPTTHAIGTLISVKTPTFAGSNPNQTITDPATLYIAGAPAAGTNMTFTNTAKALWVAGGLSQFDDRLHVIATAGSSNAPLLVENDTDNASVAALFLQGNRGASGTDGDEIYMSWLLRNAMNTATEEWGRITVEATDASGNSKDGSMFIDLMAADSLRRYLAINTDTSGLGSVVWNDDSADVDFFVTTPNLSMIAIDAGTDSIGIGNDPSNPGGTLLGIAPAEVTRTQVPGTGISIDVEAGNWQISTGGGTDASAYAAVLGTPTWNNGAGMKTVTDAANLVISGAPVAGTNMTFTNTWALIVDSGNIRFDGTLEPETQQAYTPTNVTTDRAFDADTVAIAELADVVGTLIADLQTIGLIA